jgi:hypothetical protein
MKDKSTVIIKYLLSSLTEKVYCWAIDFCWFSEAVADNGRKFHRILGSEEQSSRAKAHRGGF